MATQNVCFYNKHGFCKYSDKCRNYHENKKCEKTKCEIKKCTLRHPQIWVYLAPAKGQIRDNYLNYHNYHELSKLSKEKKWK